MTEFEQHATDRLWGVTVKAMPVSVVKFNVPKDFFSDIVFDNRSLPFLA